MSKRSRIAATVLAVLLLGGVVAWRALRVSDLTNIGTGYAAQQTCACLFISKRSLESCRMDLEPLARRLISVKPGAQEVTATSFGIARATARYTKPFGCSLEN
jgi:hypothetical protein